MKKLGLALVLCCAAFNGLAQDHKAELKGLIKKMTSFEASFNQQVIDVDGKKLMEGQGTVALAHPAKIRWHAVTPDENLMISDGKTLWIHNIDLEQVTAIDAKNAIDSTPFALLASLDDELWQKYQVSMEKSQYVISPVEQEGQVKRLLLSIKEQKFSQLAIEDISGQKSEFTFNQTKTNQTIDTEAFIFTLPEGVELDDQRQQ